MKEGCSRFIWCVASGGEIQKSIMRHSGKTSFGPKFALPCDVFLAGPLFLHLTLAPSWCFPGRVFRFSQRSRALVSKNLLVFSGALPDNFQPHIQTEKGKISCKCIIHIISHTCFKQSLLNRFRNGFSSQGPNKWKEFVTRFIGY